MNHAKSTSRFRGVSLVPIHGGWRARITLKGKTLDLGSYSSEERAARVYDKKALELYGKYYTNAFLDLYEDKEVE